MKDYKKILEGVMNIINTTEKSDIGFINICTYISENCPELKESEDERIREELMQYLWNLYHKDFCPPKPSIDTCDRWIAWLEKQGEQSLKDLPKGEDCGIDGLHAAVDILEITLGKVEGYQSSNGILEHQCAISAVKKLYEEIDNINDKGYCCVVKKQDKSGLETIKEEKADNANKVEPKFHKGNWIVNNNSGDVCQVTEIRDGEYCLCPLDAEIKGYLRFIEVDNDYHLWTIADAKDGDILVSGKEKRPFIFKGLLDELHPNNPVAYCGIDCGDRFIVTAGTVQWTDKEIEPATKEQYDLLFSKMKEADYEWDVEQKTNSQRVTSAKAKEALLLDDELTEFENESQSISLDKTINWDEIRIQAAIAAMKGMLANAALVDDAQLDYRITIEQAAVSYANTLVEELKKKE